MRSASNEIIFSQTPDHEFEEELDAAFAGAEDLLAELAFDARASRLTNASEPKKPREE